MDAGIGLYRTGLDYPRVQPKENHLEKSSSQLSSRPSRSALFDVARVSLGLEEASDSGYRIFSESEAIHEYSNVYAPLMRQVRKPLSGRDRDEWVRKIGSSEGSAS